jgi:hypothetical protein
VPDNLIHLIIVTTGEDVEADFNVNEPVKAVKMRALAGLAPGSKADEFRLEYNNEPLDEDQRLAFYVEKFGLTDGSVLELVPCPVVI